MLTVKNLEQMLAELIVLKDIGCTYDFKERFNVGLDSLATLAIVKVIRTKIPACGDHCNRYNNCQWISIFNKRKSKSKFKFTKQGLAIAQHLTLVDDLEDAVVKVLVGMINATLLGKLFGY